MNAKLTLTIEESVIKKAKKYASGKGRSLSDLIENYLKVIIRDEPKQDAGLTPVVKALKGAFRGPGNSDYKAELTKRLAKKYM